MSERIIRVLIDYAPGAKCMQHWSMSEQSVSPLMMLADAANAEKTLADNMWVYHCREHETWFPVHRECPANDITLRAGETVSVDSKMAQRLVEMNVAVYPTHDTQEEQPTDYVGKINALLEAEGLPQLDNEAARVITADNRKISKHYRSKPEDSGLARELGIDPSDIAEMRKLSKGNQ